MTDPDLAQASPLRVRGERLIEDSGSRGSDVTVFDLADADSVYGVRGALVDAGADWVATEEDSGSGRATIRVFTEP